MPLLLDFQSCAEVDSMLLDEVFDAGGLDPATQRDRVFRLLDRMERVSRPQRGAHRVFAVLGRLSGCSWLEGPLDILVNDLAEQTEIEVRVDGRNCLVELRTLTLRAPYSELSGWVAEHPYDIAPLGVYGPPKDAQFRLRSDLHSIRPPVR